MNETASREWLSKAWHHFSSAKVLFDANHYTDVIAVELHYAVEITLKSLLAFKNKKIPKTHDLLSIYKLVREKINLSDEEIELLDIISQYHIGESYPTPDRSLPPKEEIIQTIDFTSKIFIKTCAILDIDSESLK